MNLPSRAVFARSTGRMMLEMQFDASLGASCICPGGTVHVKPHPKGKDYKKLMPYEKQRDAIWPEEWCYRPGKSPALNLLEWAEWNYYHPENLIFLSEAT